MLLPFKLSVWPRFRLTPAQKQDQCIFLKYFKMARRPFVPFGWRIEARAGYDELSQADDGDSHARMSKIAEEGAVDLDYGSFKVLSTVASL